MVLPSTGWREPMKLTQTHVVTFSKTFIYSSGVASGISTSDVRLERGFTVWPTT